MAAAETIPKQTNRNRQQFYMKSKTTPYYMLQSSCAANNSTLPTRFPRRTIKSLNFNCLSKIFNHLSFKDLINCRLVCSFWNECVQYHLARRTYFIYGKQYNTLNQTDDYDYYNEPLSFDANANQNQFLLSFNSFNSCEKCQAIMQERISSARSNNKIETTDYSPITASENTSSSSSSAISSMSASQTSLLSSDFVDNNDNNDQNFDQINIDDYRCSNCQAIYDDLKLFTAEKQLNSNSNNNKLQSYFDEYTDMIRLNIFERLLSQMPKLKYLKYAEGYRYGLKHNFLNVFGVNVILRTHRHCPLLTGIDLSNCIGLMETDFYQLAKFYGQQLISLNVSGCRIDEVCLRLIVKSCDKLRYLNIANNFCVLQATCLEWISDRIETIVADYNQNVRVLDGLILGKGRNIIELELNVGYCFNASMPYKILGNHFQNLISLKIIFKSFGKHKKGMFTHLSQLQQLECLYLLEEIDDFNAESSLDDESVLAIMESCGHKLRELYLHASSSLFGCRSLLTDESISKIDLYCPLLEIFSIKRASITDLSLHSIAKLTNAYTVQLIDLEYISENGIKTIMTSFQENENKHKQHLRQICGVDIDIGQNGPNIQKVKRN